MAPPPEPNPVTSVEVARPATLDAPDGLRNSPRTGTPPWDAPRDYGSLGPGAITIRFLWRWWARQGLNLGPRDYESPILFVYGAASGRTVTDFPVALPIGDRNRAYPEPGCGSIPNGMRVSRRSGRVSGNRTPNVHRTELRICTPDTGSDCMVI